MNVKVGDRIWVAVTSTDFLFGGDIKLTPYKGTVTSAWQKNGKLWHMVSYKANNGFIKEVEASEDHLANNPSDAIANRLKDYDTIDHVKVRFIKHTGM